MKEIVYIKEVNNYDEILKNDYKRIPLFIKKIIFLYKNIFGVITKRKIEEYNIWVLPFKDKYSENKINKVINKLSIYKNKVFLVSNKLRENKVHNIMKSKDLDYITEEKTKKILLTKTLEYICNIQKINVNNLELTILVNDASKFNLYIIEQLSKIVKNLKIVSLNIYKFKKLEEKMYKDYGIAIQFSNSYRKSLKKSNLIINFDFEQVEINEYEIYTDAIIINCLSSNLKIKSKLFNGIIVNSYDINFKKEIIDKFKKSNIYENYTKLLLYASIIENEFDISKNINNLDNNKILITKLIGNNGTISKKEFKNVNKKLDKSEKTE